MSAREAKRFQNSKLWKRIAAANHTDSWREPGAELNSRGMYVLLCYIIELEQRVAKLEATSKG